MPEENTAQVETNQPATSGGAGNIPNTSEAFRNVPNRAEAFGNVPQPSEAFQRLSQSAERKADHSLTVREVTRMFEAAGVARTERSIVNWCQPNRTGIARLDSYYDPNERRYYITPQSVSLAIQEEQSKATRQGDHIPSPKPHAGPHPGNEAKQHEDPAKEADGSGEARALRQENLDLKITNRAKDMFIEQLQKEREGFALERQGYVEKLMAHNHRIGQLETQLLRLSAPNGSVPKEAENQADQGLPLETEPTGSETSGGQ